MFNGHSTCANDVLTFKLYTFVCRPVSCNTNIVPPKIAKKPNKFYFPFAAFDVNSSLSWLSGLSVSLLGRGEHNNATFC